MVKFPEIPHKPKGAKRRFRLRFAITVEVYDDDPSTLAYAVVHGGMKRPSHGYMDARACESGEGGPWGLCETLRDAITYALFLEELKTDN